MVLFGPCLPPALQCRERMEVRICIKSAGQAHSLRTPPTDSRAAHRLTGRCPMIIVFFLQGRKYRTCRQCGGGLGEGTLQQCVGRELVVVGGLV
uniref:Uncharacterized protein n=1 Tax=Cyclopterus lumpus TaxID=8103 RepID=A0A8C2XG23_CYCLU